MNERFQNPSVQELVGLALRGCQIAQASAEALLEGFNTRSEDSLGKVSRYEDELDTLHRQVNEAVIRLIPATSDESQARQLIVSLKFIIELEQIGDLLLNVVNRFRAAAPRLEANDIRELAGMTNILMGMLGSVADAFVSRDVGRAIAVLREDAELDRLRNLMIVRHVENPENLPVGESYHMVFMAQILERSGDHVKHLAEEICRLVTGRSVRHLLREYEKPRELAAIEKSKARRARTT